MPSVSPTIQRRKAEWRVKDNAISESNRLTLELQDPYFI